MDPDFPGFSINSENEIIQAPFDIDFAEFLNFGPISEQPVQNDKAETSQVDPSVFSFLDPQCSYLPDTSLNNREATTPDPRPSTLNNESTTTIGEDSSMDNTCNSSAIEQWMLFKQKIGYRQEADLSKDTEISCVVEDREIPETSNNQILDQEKSQIIKPKTVTFKESPPDIAPPQIEYSDNSTQAILNYDHVLSPTQENELSQVSPCNQAMSDFNVDISQVEDFLTQQLTKLSAKQEEASPDNTDANSDEPHNNEESMWKLFKQRTNYHATASIDIPDTITDETPKGQLDFQEVVSENVSRADELIDSSVPQSTFENDKANDVSSFDAVSQEDKETTGNPEFKDGFFNGELQDFELIKRELDENCELLSDQNYRRFSSQLDDANKKDPRLEQVETPNSVALSENNENPFNEKKLFVRSPSSTSTRDLETYSDDIKTQSASPMTSGLEDSTSSDSVQTPLLSTEVKDLIPFELTGDKKRTPTVSSLSTPLIHSVALSKLAGCQIFLKLENLQPGGTHKIRGIMQWLSIMARCHGVNSAAGRKMEIVVGGFPNMSIAAAAAVDRFNTIYKPVQAISVNVVIPERAPDRLLKMLGRFKAHIEVFGDSWEEASNHVRTMLLTAEQRRREAKVPLAQSPVTLTVPTSHTELVNGMKQISQELRFQLKDFFQHIVLPDAVICPVGSGTLLESIASDLSTYDKATKVQMIGVETHSTDTLHSSILADQVVPRYHSSLKVDSGIFSLAEPCLSLGAFEATLSRPITPLIISDSMATNAALRFSEDHQFIVEPACAVALSPIYHGLLPKLSPNLNQDSVIVVIVTGGNLVKIEDLAHYALKFRKPIIQARSKDNIFLDLSPPRNNSVRSARKSKFPDSNVNQSQAKKAKTGSDSES